MGREAGRARDSAYRRKIGKRKSCCTDRNDVAVVEQIETFSKELQPDAFDERDVLCDVRIERNSDRQVEGIEVSASAAHCEEWAQMNQACAPQF